MSKAQHTPGIKIIPLDSESGISETVTSFDITTATKDHERAFVIGSVSKKVRGWHWCGLGKAGIKQFPDFESAARAAQKAFGKNIQFEERA